MLTLISSEGAIAQIVKSRHSARRTRFRIPSREEKSGPLFQSNLKESVGGFTHLACWEVASPVILRLGGKGHVAECDSEGVCTHLGASLVKVKQKPKSVAKLTHSLGG